MGESSLAGICPGLHELFPSRSKAEWRAHLLKGREKKSRHYRLNTRRVTYTQLKAVKEIPLLGESSYRGGVIAEAVDIRKKPFGSLANVTIGNLHKSETSGDRLIAYNGLELAFDSLLRGKPGMEHRRKVMNKYLSIHDVAPVDGCDIVSTIDVEIQDLAEKALRDKLEEINAETGVAIVMEVKTGDIRAMVNLDRLPGGGYAELTNHAISDMLEPGSVMKTASLMVALEDGYISMEDSVYVGRGDSLMHKKHMYDHNHRTGGYRRSLSLTEILMYSSNIGVSALIDRHYGVDRQRKQQFLDGLDRVGITQPLDIQLRGAATPYIRRLESKHWSATSLPWLSIGYESQVPPLNVLTFYNAIANNGKMVKPRFVTEVRKDGHVIERYPVEVLRKHICSKGTLQKIQYMLHEVVSRGLGKAAGSNHFDVSGKTGTAQVAMGGEYRAGRMYLVSFCGYFPSEAPRYSCMVAIRVRTSSPSGGTMSGAVFSRIAERIYAKELVWSIEEAKDTLHAPLPRVMNGELGAAKRVLDELHLPTVWGEQKRGGDWEWGRVESGEEVIELLPWQTATDKVPNVKGMGAKDAVYLLEQLGMRVALEGVGTVHSQSVPPGTTIRKGGYITLTLK